MTDVADRPPRAVRQQGLLDSLRSAATIASVFLVSLVFVLGLVAFLGYFKFESSLTTIAERRIALIADRARGSIEQAIRLGLKLEDINALRGVVEEAQAEDPRVQSVQVFSTHTGRNVFASEPAAIDAPTDHAWLHAQSTAEGVSWRIQSGNQAVVGRRLDSSIAPGIGGIVIVYSLEDVIARIEAMRGKLIVAAAITLAAFSALALAGAIFLTKGFRRTIGGLADAMVATDPSAAGSGVPDSLRNSVERFNRAIGEASLQLDRFETALPQFSGRHGSKTVAIR